MVTALIALSLATIAGISSASAAGVAGAEPDKRHATVELVSEQTELVPGSTANLGIHFKLEPHWHVYWHGWSDSGGAIEIKLDLPAGYVAGTTEWPAPIRKVENGDIVNHVYEDELTLIVPIKVPSTATGKASISGKVGYVICASACVMEDAPLSLSIPVAAAGSKPADSRSAKLFKATRARLPKHLPTDSGIAVKREARTAAIDAPGAKGLTFFPDENCPLLADVIHTTTADQPKLSLKIDPDSDAAQALTGVLEVRYPDTRGTLWYDISVPAPGGPKPFPPPGPAGESKTDPKSKH